MVLSSLGSLHIYRKDDGSEIATAPLGFQSGTISFSPDAELLALRPMFGTDGHIVDASRGTVLREMPKQSFVALGQEARTYWHIGGGEQRLTGTHGDEDLVNLMLPDDFNVSYQSLFCPDGSRLVVVGGGSALLVGLHGTCWVLAQIGVENWIASMHFRSDSSQLLLHANLPRDSLRPHPYSEDTIIDARTGKQIKRLHLPASELGGSPEGAELLFGLGGPRLRFGEPFRGKSLAPLQDRSVSRILYSPSAYKMAITFCTNSFAAKFC